MHTQIYVNLPVKDISKSRAFFESLGYKVNEQWSNEQAFCLVLGENMHAMLLQEAFFKTFINRPIPDAQTTTGVLTCLSCTSREQVDDLVAKAVAAGGSIPRAPVDHGFMYQHAFEDIDGHIWELMAMTNASARA